MIQSVFAGLHSFLLRIPGLARGIKKVRERPPHDILGTFGVTLFRSVNLFVGVVLLSRENGTSSENVNQLNIES